MIRISQIKLKIDHTTEQLEQRIRKILKLPKESALKYQIVKQSIDARKKNELMYIYSVELSLPNEKKLVEFLHSQDVILVNEKSYQFPVSGLTQAAHRPIIVGAGPAGLFCGLFLARAGYRPILLERGEDVDSRVNSVDQFWKNNELNPDSNVQFGEGGAGTFSDGKLNTLVKDPVGRNKKVLEVFAEHGAPADILYRNKPHIGTDQLRGVVKSMREEIISLGGEVCFQTKVTDILIENGCVSGVEVVESEKATGELRTKSLTCETLILAIGHSARDTFEVLLQRKLSMVQKSFAIGLRIEHPQTLISENQYGNEYEKLPPADYKVTHQAKNGRSVYSFCMCPGGFVVNASSEEQLLAVNGMSNYARDEANANSALIVTVTPEDFASDSPLAGVEFQRKWERLAFAAGKGLIPVQMFGDFEKNVPTTQIGHIHPNMKGNVTMANLRTCLPSYVSESIVEGVYAFDRKIRGFADKEAILSGVETRTSSPVRIVRDELFESNIKGIFPCGEGAGYAGGITSAAMDGIKIAEAIASKYRPIV